VDLFEDAAPWQQLGNLTAAMQQLNLLPEDTVADVRRKEELFRRYDDESSYRTSGRFLADLWCAAFVWKKTRAFDYPITERIFRRVWKNPHDVQPWMYQEVRRLVNQYQFFHWHLAYPDVLRVPPKDATAENEQTGWSGGFDVVLGNPPWERIKIQEKEWFAARRPDIAAAGNAAQRRKKIASLQTEDPALYAAFLADRRKAEGESHLVRDSSSGGDEEAGQRRGMYPLCGRGDVNTYTLFAELNRNLLRPTGRVGCIVPAGIATDDTTKIFFKDLMEGQSLVSLYAFENEEHVFVDVHNAFRFCLLTLSGPARPSSKADFVFQARQAVHLQEAERHFTLDLSDLQLLNPNTQTCPTFRSRHDAELNKAIYRRIPVLLREGPPEASPWAVRLVTMFHMANDSYLFRERETLEADGWTLNGNTFHKDGQAYVPLYEAKMVHQFDHRYGTYEGQTQAQSNKGFLPYFDEVQHADPNRLVQPWFWVPASEVAQSLRGKWNRKWLLGWREICRNSDTRTVIASLMPLAAVGNKVLLMLPSMEASRTAILLGNLCAYIFDYLARQKVSGSSLNYFTMKQLPVLLPDHHNQPTPWSAREPLLAWLFPRVLELTYTAWDMEAFARDCGHQGPPFRWDEARRFLLRCELDAAFFHLYGLNREDADYVLETFPVVKKRDLERHGEHRTKRMILEIFDALAAATRNGQPYQTRLDPPPADSRVAHPARSSITEAV
jgi:hypothetical protein